MGSHNHYKVFGFFNRKFKISEPEPPPAVREAFRWFAGAEDGLMEADQMLKFLVEHQREDGCFAADARAIVEKVLHRRGVAGVRGGLSLHDFFWFLCQDDINGPIDSKVHHDMDSSMQHYFIYTGHNSYLTGNQLSSESSEIPIVKALENGVRTIELDLWPNSTNDNIKVVHGRTLTSPVSLITCFKGIKEHAFLKSPYPVIITLEDHLTPQLQAKVAEMAIRIFGDMLYCPERENLFEFPSPEALKHKIILSTKPPKEYVGSKSNKDGEDNSVDENDSSEDEQLIEPEADYKSGIDQEDVDGESYHRKQGHPTAPEYKNLIGIQAGHAKKGLRVALRNQDHRVHRLSLSEQKLEKAIELYPTDIVRFTQKNILRVYPKGTRVTSSNFKPIIAWIYGAQMVAFNMQGYGKELWMMQGLFRSNGGCGYVKKPDLLMRRGKKNEVFNPKAVLSIKKTLKVTVHMGDGWRYDFSRTHFDKFSPPDFYTKMQIVGVESDMAKSKTRILEDDWIPCWNQEFSFPLTVPELALLRIEVKEHDRSEKDGFGGQTCLPVSEVKPGIRSVPLYDKKGHKFNSVRLLMSFRFE